MRAGALALAPFEVAVGGRGDALVLARRVTVHPDAHGAAGLAPLEAGRGEDLVEPFRLGGALDEPGAWDDPGPHDGAAPLGDGRRRSEVLDAAVRAGADEDAVHHDVGERHAGPETHVVERAPHGSAAGRIALPRGIGHVPGNGQRVLRARAPGHRGSDAGSIQLDLSVERGVRIRRQRLPVLERRVPLCALRRVRPPFDIGERGRVGRDHAGARAGLDGHVAHGHPLLHGHGGDGRSGVFDDVPHPAGGADPGDDGEDDILGADARGPRASDPDPHHLGLLLPQALGRQHVLDLGRADAEGEGAESSVGGRVRVAADEGDARLGQTLLGADDMHDALARVARTEEGDALLARRALEALDHPADLIVGARLRPGARRGRRGGPRSSRTWWAWSVSRLARVRGGRHERDANFSSIACHQSKPTLRKMSMGESTGPSCQSVPVSFSCWSERSMAGTAAAMHTAGKMTILKPIRSSSATFTAGVRPPWTMLARSGALTSRATRWISSSVWGASTKITSAPASAARLPRSMASSRLVTARASVRAMMTRSGSVRYSLAARILSQNPCVGMICLPAMWPHFLGATWSSMCSPATPARSYSRTVRTTFSTLP